jgi:catechol 2,3-dioxygenase-like lactoylglutathione lyase family enzyme
MAVALDHVVIHVSDWERSNAFYRDVLGAELIERDGSEARHYRFGAQQLNVHGPGQEPAPVAARPAEPGGADLCFVWEGPIDGAVGHLESHGVPVEVGPVTRYGGRGRGTSVYFRDPDGSLLEFLSYT